MTNIRTRVIFVFCAVFASLFFLITNVFNPMTGEDYSLSYLLGKEYHDAKPLSFQGSLLSILKAVSFQSQQWNARLGEQLAILFLALPTIFYVIVNTIMGILYFFFISYFAFGRRPSITRVSDSIAIALTFSCVMLCMPATGEIFFLRNTATNYLWAMNIIFVFLIPYFAHLNTHVSKKHSIIMIPVMLFLGFLTGMTNENTGIAVLFGICMYLLYEIVHKKRPPIWSFSGALGLLSGMIYLLLSPSTQVRVRYYSSIFIKTDPTVHTYFRRALSIFRDFVLSGIGILAFLAIAVIAYLFTVVHMNNKKPVKQIYMVVSSLITVAVLILAPYHEIRSFLPAYTCILILSCRLVSDTLSTAKPSLVKYCVVLSLALLFGSFLYSGMVTQKYIYFHRECTELDKEIRKQVSEGNTVIRVKPFKTKTKRYLSTRQKYLEWAWQYPAYYGAQKITFDAEE